MKLLDSLGVLSTDCGNCFERFYESSDSLCRLVHFVCALLACSAAGACALSVGMADLAAAAAFGYYARSGVRVFSHPLVSSCPSSELPKKQGWLSRAKQNGLSHFSCLRRSI